MRAERLRLGLNQIEFGELGGISKNAQLGYEKGERSPGADYLMALLPHGVDVHFLLTGTRAGQAGSTLPREFERALLLLGQLQAEELKVALTVIEALVVAKGR